jgi:hypothetical protein
MTDNNTNKPSLSEICYDIYQRKGQYGVYDFIKANHPEIEWDDCEPCEDRTPIDADGDCLVCASPVKRKPSYPGTTEIAPGVYLDTSENPAIYFADKQGEIVTWNYDEVKEDPSAWVASLSAVLRASKEGVSALRKITCQHVPNLAKIESWYEDGVLILDSECKVCGNPCSWDATPSKDRLNWERD